jgi:hypothetical protein
MAVDPLFVPSMADLKRRLALSGSTQTDTQAEINTAAIEVNVRLHARLGEALVAQIQAIPDLIDALNPSADPPVLIEPTDADGRLRAMAEQAEVLWVKWILIQELPTLFMDSSFNVDQQWNEEGLTRRTNPTNVQDMADRVWKRLQDILGFITSSNFTGMVDARIIEPDASPAPLRPGGTIR